MRTPALLALLVSLTTIAAAQGTENGTPSGDDAYLTPLIAPVKPAAIGPALRGFLLYYRDHPDEKPNPLLFLSQAGLIDPRLPAEPDEQYRLLVRCEALGVRPDVLEDCWRAWAFLNPLRGREILEHINELRRAERNDARENLQAAPAGPGS